MNGDESSSIEIAKRSRPSLSDPWQIVVLLAIGLLGSFWIGAQRQPEGFDPGPRLVENRILLKKISQARLTIVFAPARPGCSSCIEPPVETLHRFLAAYPDAHVVTALQSDLHVGREVLAGGDRFDLIGKTEPRFAGQDLGVIAAFDSAGRTLLFHVLTHASFDRLYDDLETAYSLTAPRGSRWASLETSR